MNEKTTRSWIEVDLDAITHNIEQLSKLLPEKNTLMAVVKADGYGHGAIRIAQHCQTLGITDFAVATIDEGIELREHGIKGNILILGYTDAIRAYELYYYQLIQTVVNDHHAYQLEKQKYPLDVHLKIDTGMHRLGFDVDDIEVINDLYDYQYLKIKGIFSHLCVCDSKNRDDIQFTKQQIKVFFNFINKLKKLNRDVGKIHLQSSYGLINYSKIKCDYARIGIALYGVKSSLDDYIKNKIDLQPALQIKARIAMLHQVAKGTSLGYGRSYVAFKDSTIAVVPIGYGDGLPRSLSFNDHVLIKGCKCPIVGRICMDQMLVDVSMVDKISYSDIVTIVGKDGDNEIRVETIAQLSQTISNEILSRLGTRLPRIYRGGNNIEEKKLYVKLQSKQKVAL